MSKQFVNHEDCDEHGCQKPWPDKCGERCRLLERKMPVLRHVLCDFATCQYKKSGKRSCHVRCEKLAHEDAVSLATTGAQTSRARFARMPECQVRCAGYRVFDYVCLDFCERLALKRASYDPLRFAKECVADKSMTCVKDETEAGLTIKDVVALCLKIVELDHNLDIMVMENQALRIEHERWEHVKEICSGHSGGGMDDCLMVALPYPKDQTGCVSTADVFVKAIDESIERWNAPLAT